LHFTFEDLHVLKRMVEVSGIINAFDGQQWIDLRVVIGDVIDFTLAQADVIAELEAALKEAQEENRWLQTPANHHDGA
jgi:hypothetical protein